jgi:hypothetical protein
MLTISNVRVHPLKFKLKNGVVGLAQVLFKGGLLITGLELVERNNKRFIQYPKNPNNNRGLCYCQPLNSILSGIIEKKVFEIYDKLKTQSGNVNLDENFMETAMTELCDTLHITKASGETNEETKDI